MKMEAFCKIIVMSIMTSSVIFGYGNVFGSQHQLNRGRFGADNKLSSLDPAYDFFKRSTVIKKPVIEEVNILPEVYVIDENFQRKSSSNPINPPQNVMQGVQKEKTNVKRQIKVELKRPLVQLLNKQNSEIGKAIEEYFNTKLFEKKAETPVKQPTITEKADTEIDKQVQPSKESFPVPMTQGLDMHSLRPSGPGPYRNCFPPSMVVCGARLPWGHVMGMADWCEQNCDKDAYTKHCDDIRCTCKCLAPGDPF